jgi:hypothetical protein
MKSFSRLMNKTFELPLGEAPFWETTCGRVTERGLALTTATYRSGFFSFLSGVFMKELTDSPAAGYAYGSTMFLGSMLSQVSLFTHSNKAKAEPRNHKGLLALSHAAAMMHSLNNTTTYLNALRLMVNYFGRLSVGLSVRDNSRNENILLLAYAVFGGIPFLDVMKKTYLDLNCQLFNIEDPVKNPMFLGFPGGGSYGYERNVLNKFKAYTAFSKALLTALSVNLLISNAYGDDRIIGSLLVAGIPTLLTFYANLVGGCSLYFNSKKTGAAHANPILLHNVAGVFFNEATETTIPLLPQSTKGSDASSFISK